MIPQWLRTTGNLRYIGALGNLDIYVVEDVEQEISDVREQHERDESGMTTILYIYSNDNTATRVGWMPGDSQPRILSAKNDKSERATSQILDVLKPFLRVYAPDQQI